MLRQHLTFHHLGLATKRHEKAVAFCQALGYSVGSRIHDPLQKVNLSMCTHTSEPNIEIISPEEEIGPLNAYLETSQEIVYHVGYTTLDREAALKDIASAGFRVITVSEPRPAVLFDGKLVSFYRIVGYGLIEFIEEASV